MLARALRDVLLTYLPWQKASRCRSISMCCSLWPWRQGRRCSSGWSPRFGPRGRRRPALKGEETSAGPVPIGLRRASWSPGEPVAVPSRRGGAVPPLVANLRGVDSGFAATAS